MIRFYTFFFLVCLVAIACKDSKKYHDEQLVIDPSASPFSREIMEYRNNLNTEYRNPDTSPLIDSDRARFEGLDFFPPNESYMVTAFLERTPESEPFLLPTTTGQKSLERIFGVAHFQLNGKSHQLEVYQSLDLMEKEGYEDYLFLPFLDETNGNETYGGGRYLDLRIPEGDSLVIDFNRAYNPYCVYNKKYSCPLVPRQNYLKTKVMAGVKDFKGY